MNPSVSKRAAPPRPPRWFRFSLRSLLIFTVLVGSLMGWIASERRQSAHEHRIAEMLEEQGWYVEFEGPFHIQTGNPNFPQFEPKPQSTWRRIAAQVLGDRIVSLTTLDTVESLDPLAELTRLRVLDINQSNDGNLAPLAKLTTLEALIIADKPFEDMSPLAGLQNLESLFIVGTQITDLTPLAELKKLRELRIRESKVSNITPLAALTNLEVLELLNTEVVEFMPLVGLRNLAELGVSDELVSKEQVSALRNRLPNCVVTQYTFGCEGWTPCD